MTTTTTKPRPNAPEMERVTYSLNTLWLMFTERWRPGSDRRRRQRIGYELKPLPSTSALGRSDTQVPHTVCRHGNNFGYVSAEYSCLQTPQILLETTDSSSWLASAILTSYLEAQRLEQKVNKTRSLTLSSNTRPYCLPLPRSGRANQIASMSFLHHRLNGAVDKRTWTVLTSYVRFKKWNKLKIEISIIKSIFLKSSNQINTELLLTSTWQAYSVALSFVHAGPCKVRKKSFAVELSGSLRFYC